MQGIQRLKQPKFVTIDLNRFIPKTHKLRRIHQSIDLSFLREMTRDLYSKKDGRPSIDPVLFFRMMILKHLYGISSDRQLCDEIHVNLAYRWFCRLSLEDRVPDHSSISRTRDRFGEDIFMKVFENVVGQCRKAGLVKGKQMVTDATLIEANASNSAVVKKSELGKIAAMAASEPAKAAEPTANQVGQRREKFSPKTHVNKTDPESSMVSRHGYKKRFYYKGHFTIDGAKKVITDCHVTTGSQHECKVFEERAEHVMKRFEIKPSEWLADRGYGHGPAYRYLNGKKITSFISLRDNKLGRGKHSPGDGFEYIRDKNIYVCSKGHAMHPHKQANGFTRYRITGGQCVTCPLRVKCLGADKQVNKRIQRADYQDEYDEVHSRRSSVEFRAKRHERAWKIEGVFGEGKTRHGLSRANYRGRWKVQTQVYLIAIVHNVKRLEKAMVLSVADVISLCSSIAVLESPILGGQNLVHEQSNIPMVA